MRVFPLVLHRAYYQGGFFNITTEFDALIRADDGPIELVLIGGGSELRVEADVDRHANGNGTARIRGRGTLKGWLNQHFKQGDRVDVEVHEPTRLVIRK